jgi:hypothetical protein
MFISESKTRTKNLCGKWHIVLAFALPMQTAHFGGFTFT